MKCTGLNRREPMGVQKLMAISFRWLGRGSTSFPPWIWLYSLIYYFFFFGRKVKKKKKRGGGGGVSIAAILFLPLRLTPSAAFQQQNGRRRRRFPSVEMYRIFRQVCNYYRRFFYANQPILIWNFSVFFFIDSEPVNLHRRKGIYWSEG